MYNKIDEQGKLSYLMKKREAIYLFPEELTHKIKEFCYKLLEIGDEF
jgi:hypothetical protein